MPQRTLQPIAMLATLALLGAGCSGTRPVTLLVTDQAGDPVAGATVGAVPINTSDIPLPLTSDTLAEILSGERQRRFGVTDADGLVRLLLMDRPHAVSIGAPALGDPWWPQGQDDAPPAPDSWLFTLLPGTGEIVPPSDHVAPIPLNVTDVR